MTNTGTLDVWCIARGGSHKGRDVWRRASTYGERGGAESGGWEAHTVSDTEGRVSGHLRNLPACVNTKSNLINAC